MRGISEERLKEVFSWFYWPSDAEKKFFESLLSECTELNAWHPIDENTPKNRNLMLYFPTGPINWRKWVGHSNSDWPFPPTHWQELPKDPK